MLTDTKLRALKPTGKLYKIPDRDGLYAAVTPTGAVSFRFNYRLNGRQETLTLGRYGAGGLTLGEAREKLSDAKKMILVGKSPAREKSRGKARINAGETFGAWAEKWLELHEMADSTRDMRRSVYERDVKPRFANVKLMEITHEDVRALADAIVARGAPATALHAREIVMLVFRFAILKGQQVSNPADLVAPTSIARFTPRDRSLEPAEIKVFYRYLERIGTSPSIRAAARLLLLTMLRKTEMTKGEWTEVSFMDAVWTIPPERMKMRREHRVPLSSHALELLQAMQPMRHADGLGLVFPSPSYRSKPLSENTLNSAMARMGYKGSATAHGFRALFSTVANECGWNPDVIERQLAHKERNEVRAAYHRTTYMQDRTRLLQWWGDYLDGRKGGKVVKMPQRAA